MNPNYEQYEHLRIKLEREANSFNIPTFSHEAFKKSKDEKALLKIARKDHKKAKENPVRFKEVRDEFIQTIVKSPIPKWGSISFNLLKRKNQFPPIL